jgi:hypothetical protein
MTIKSEQIAVDEQTEEPKWAVDEQTGKPFKLEPEKTWDTVAAIISILYSIAMLVFFSWLALDFFAENKSLLKFLGLQDAKILESPFFRLIAYTVIGGGLGGTINGIRSFIVWHCERKAFGWRFVWKNITFPLIGPVLAAIVYAIVRGGIAAFGGGFAPTEQGEVQGFTAFAIGALAGYGSHKVFRWFDDQVNKLFRISPIEETKVPDLAGKSKDEAETLLKEVSLNLGKVDYEPSADPGKIDKIIGQNPPPDTKIRVDGSVDITIARKT